MEGWCRNWQSFFLIEINIPEEFPGQNKEIARLFAASAKICDALIKSRREHYYCEDSWYSCPMHKDGCANESEEEVCNCGAETWNKYVSDILKEATGSSLEELI